MTKKQAAQPATTIKQNDTTTDAIVDATPAASSSSVPPKPAAVIVPTGYNADRAEMEIRALKEEANDIRRRAHRNQTETTDDRMRAKEIQTEIQQKQAVLSQYRKNASGMAILALSVLLLISLVWILLEWESPIAWMEELNKERRHAAMMKATGGQN